LVVAMVGILAAVAYPSYQEQVRSGRRSEAQAELMRLAQFMERIYTETGCYNPGDDNVCGTGDDAAPTIATSADHYSVTFAAGVGANAFTLQATPTGPQAGDGVLQIDELGQKFWDENGDDGTGAGADAVGLEAASPDAKDLDWVRG
jgi:type IV pilus assembly protein PilE